MENYLCTLESVDWFRDYRKSKAFRPQTSPKLGTADTVLQTKPSLNPVKSREKCDVANFVEERFSFISISEQGITSFCSCSDCGPSIITEEKSLFQIDGVKFVRKPNEQPASPMPDYEEVVYGGNGDQCSCNLSEGKGQDKVKAEKEWCNKSHQLSPCGQTESNLNPVKSYQRMLSDDSCRPTWRDHLVGVLKDNEVEVLRKYSPKDFNHHLATEMRINPKERDCNQELSSSTPHFTPCPFQQTSFLERQSRERTPRTRFKSPGFKTEEMVAVSQKQLVKKPRAVSLERATLCRKNRIRNGHHTPPRKYLKQFQVRRNDLSSSNRISLGKKTVDTPLCDPGSAVKQARSCSVTTSLDFNSKILVRQRSCSGKLGDDKASSRRIDEETLKRTRINSVQYELSQDLQDKQVEMLEQKYGGISARKAALTIQRAFRKHCMNKRFQQLTYSVKRERRLSRRFFVPVSEDKVCLFSVPDGDTFYGKNSSLSNDLHFCHSTDYIDTVVKSNISTLFRDFGDSKFSPSDCQLRHPVTKGQGACAHSYLTKSDFSNRTVMFNSPSCLENATPSGNALNSVTLYDPDFTSVPVTGDDDVCCMSTVNARPRQPTWMAVPSSGRKRFINTNKGPVLFLSPSQLNVSDENYAPRYSLALEETAMSLSGQRNSSVDFLSEEQQNICQTSSVRQTVSNPVTCTSQPDHCKLWWTTVKVGDDQRKSITICVEQNKLSNEDLKMTSSIQVKSRKKLPEMSHQVPSFSRKAISLGVDSKLPTGLDSNSEHAEKTKQSLIKGSLETSPAFQTKVFLVADRATSGGQLDDKRFSNISENSEDSLESGSYSTTPPNAPSGHNCSDCCRIHNMTSASSLRIFQTSEVQRKRQYRIGLNMFNKKPEKGINYLIQKGFLEATPKAVARFLISRKGLSRQNIGEYLGNLQNHFISAVLKYYVEDIDLAGMQVDVALRKYQTFFRMPGEAQKIERLVEVFSQRYSHCNRDIVSKFHSPDTVFVLAFAIIMLNTDLHTPNLKADKRMKLDDFIKNLKGIDDGHDLDRDMLSGIYERIKTSEFKTGSDHVTQVMKVQQTIVGKKPNLAHPHRRLVCYCRLYEVYDITKKERPGIHQREVFLFNDTLLVSKIFSKKKTGITYTFRQSFPLCGVNVLLFEAPHYSYGIRLTRRVDNKVLITFNARNMHDRTKFVDDLRESILEMDEMENLRIEAELEKQKSLRTRATENRDSGVTDIEVHPSTSQERKRLCPDGQSSNRKRSSLSNSLLDLYDHQMNKPVRRGSAGSLDSGMSVSFQSSATSTESQDSSSQGVSCSGTCEIRNISETIVAQVTQGEKSTNQQSFLGGLFGKKNKTHSKGNIAKVSESTDV
ncbi:IQ motif and SEC7 domain-containing protein 1-like isoform X1 [Tachypleus tridentatus]|uniref:IQ motif and SEC7 domain-containing protein 1-like isoform X1 n=1 Tax=Tachypleus tridentatus TaxID=6853 RepID=UPI003FD6ABF2